MVQRAGFERMLVGSLCVARHRRVGSIVLAQERETAESVGRQCGSCSGR